VERLRALPLTEAPTRFELDDDAAAPGVTAQGVSEGLSLDGHRTLYGATKLAAEILIQEYVATFGLRAVVNRCGVVAGPWQMGKVDQGVVSYWMLAHMFRRPLTYIGFGGSGKQVRDLLHVDDLLALVDTQLSDPAPWSGVVANVGGGLACSASLLELTGLCAEITGNVVDVSATPEDRPGDIPWYVTDSTRLNGLTSWRPSSTLRGILTDVHEWIRDNERALGPALALQGER
jgi:CDP-paratose 2-epimerase